MRQSTGDDSELLRWSHWDVSELKGKQARIRIFDRHRAGWGHINVDQIVFADVPRSGVDPTRLRAYRASAEYLDEPFRPQFHFTPEINWMNDPNGLVFFAGEYHLFFQYNPFGNEWGHMSWGHAVSRDLVHWEHLPLALAEEDGTMIFSGCAVVDWKNTSGFGRGGIPPMVAIYTGHRSNNQSQHVAFSLDRGRTWTKFAGNPVIDIGEKDFRDPKVFWHEATKRWIMVVALAVAKKVQFYSSPDLKTWTLQSAFGPAGVESKSNWECPDLFELPIEGSEETCWVLEVDMGQGAIAGGSGGEYFVGDFDGNQFTPKAGDGDAKWVDFGRDFYAPASWSDIPDDDGRRIWIGWMNNWETCLLPTSPWRSAMSVPRVLSLRRREDRLVLVQRPIRELQRLRKDSLVRLSDETVARSRELQMTHDGLLEIVAEFKPRSSRTFGLRVAVGANESTTIGFNLESNELFVDRSRSGDVGFHPRFAGRHAAPIAMRDGVYRIRVLLDRSSVEVFGQDGECVLTERIFPSPSSRGVEVFAENGDVLVQSLQVWRLRSIWKR
ncbi:MAG: glycoside hydrolase family 32 protein [Planctomycetota bacterium]